MDAKDALNVIVTNVEFSLREEIVGVPQDTTERDLKDNVKEHIKIFWLVLHVTYDYIGPNGKDSGTCIKDLFEVGRVSYDSDGYCGVPVYQTPLTAEDIVEAAEAIALDAAESKYNETLFLNQCNKILRETEQLEGLPHGEFYPTGLSFFEEF